MTPKTVTYPLPESQYRKEEYIKKQIYLHHTVSGPGAEGDINYWKSTPDRVATCVVIERDGDIYECFNPKYCAAHLGITSDLAKKYGDKSVPNPNELLLRHSIGIEIDSWGGLTKNDKGQWINSAKQVMPSSDIIEYPNGFRGFKAFEKYTTQQIETVKYLLEKWCKEFGIPKTYNADIWDICKRAYSLESGIFTHVSVRPDKSDMHPQPDMIETLQNLK